jgi:hypothetical protein
MALPTRDQFEPLRPSQARGLLPGDGVPESLLGRARQADRGLGLGIGLVHPKAMPVLLTNAEEWRTWLEAPAEEELQLQRPLPDEMMAEVTRDPRQDGM